MDIIKKLCMMMEIWWISASSYTVWFIILFYKQLNVSRETFWRCKNAQSLLRFAFIKRWHTANVVYIRKSKAVKRFYGLFAASTALAVYKNSFIAFTKATAGNRIQFINRNVYAIRQMCLFVFFFGTHIRQNNSTGTVQSGPGIFR